MSRVGLSFVFGKKRSNRALEVVIKIDEQEYTATIAKGSGNDCTFENSM